MGIPLDVAEAAFLRNVAQFRGVRVCASPNEHEYGEDGAKQDTAFDAEGQRGPKRQHEAQSVGQLDREQLLGRSQINESGDRDDDDRSQRRVGKVMKEGGEKQQG